MVQFIKTWIVADLKALVDDCGRYFDVSRLPARLDLEQESKASVERALEEATRGTGKDVYHKITHASELLKRLDQPRVTDRCSHCKRLFDPPDGIIGAARDGWAQWMIPPK